MVIKPLVRTISFEHNGTAYLVSFQWSFFRGVTNGKVWAAKSSSRRDGCRLLEYIGPTERGTENLLERIKFWTMVAGICIKHRLRKEAKKWMTKKQ